jgi:hypothetical protein
MENNQIPKTVFKRVKGEPWDKLVPEGTAVLVTANRGIESAVVREDGNSESRFSIGGVSCMTRLFEECINRALKTQVHSDGQFRMYADTACRIYRLLSDPESEEV